MLQQVVGAAVLVKVNCASNPSKPRFTALFARPTAITIIKSPTPITNYSVLLTGIRLLTINHPFLHFFYRSTSCTKTAHVESPELTVAAVVKHFVVALVVDVNFAAATVAALVFCFLRRRVTEVDAFRFGLLVVAVVMETDGQLEVGLLQGLTLKSHRFR